jgi:hypothetical protein
MATRGERPTRKTQPPAEQRTRGRKTRAQQGLNKPAMPVGPAHLSITTMKQALTSDWGPTLYLWTAQLAEILVAVYVAGLMFGAWLHRLNNRIARMVAS